jgi:hypothetical protein
MIRAIRHDLPPSSLYFCYQTHSNLYIVTFWTIQAAVRTSLDFHFRSIPFTIALALLTRKGKDRVLLLRVAGEIDRFEPTTN